MAHTFAHNTPEKEPDVWGMKKKKSPFGIEQSGGITTETFGSKVQILNTINIFQIINHRR